MNISATAVCTNYSLAAKGLVGLIQSMAIHASVECFASISEIFSEKAGGIQLLLFIDPEVLPGPQSFSLQKIHSNYTHITIVALSVKGLPDILLPYFDQVIYYTDTEIEIIRKLRKYFPDHAPVGMKNNIPNILSERETEILKQVAKGLTNNEISKVLFISAHTVITHRKNITAKLGIKTIAGLTIYAVINEIISAKE